MSIINKSKLGKWLSMCDTWGFSPIKTAFSLRDIPRYVSTIRTYRKQQNQAGAMPFKWKNLFPILSDRLAPAGGATGHYFHMDLWAAQQIHAVKPEEHYDVGSRIDGFIAHLLTFMPVTVIDIRPLASALKNLTFQQGDLMDLNTIKPNSIKSLSCLHACEHIGLGRYGDPIDATGHMKAMQELARILAKNGRLYFAVPCGVERVEFNAQRVFDPQTILDNFSELKLLKTAGMLDDGIFTEDINLEKLAQQNFGLGIFVFQK